MVTKNNDCSKIWSQDVAWVIDRLVAGMFPERLYPGKLNSEDTDYQMTVQANGYEIMYLGDISVIHNEKTLVEKAKKYKLTEKDLENHLVFMQRWRIKNGRLKTKEEIEAQKKTQTPTTNEEIINPV